MIDRHYEEGQWLEWSKRFNNNRKKTNNRNYTIISDVIKINFKKHYLKMLMSASKNQD